jgi:hypothetical protein
MPLLLAERRLAAANVDAAGLERPKELLAHDEKILQLL